MGTASILGELADYATGPGEGKAVKETVKAGIERVGKDLAAGGVENTSEKIFKETTEKVENKFVAGGKGGDGGTGGGGGNRTFVPEEDWQRKAPVQVTPGTPKVSEQKLSSDGVTVYDRGSHYDEYGWLEAQAHWGDHPNQHGNHPNPHHHLRNTEYGDPTAPGYKSGNVPEWKRNPDTGTVVFPGEYP